MVPPALPSLSILHVPWDHKYHLDLRYVSIQDYADMDIPQPGGSISPSEIPLVVIILTKNNPIACGALHLLPTVPGNERTITVESIYTLPNYRGKEHGVSDLVMRELERAARMRGWVVLRVELHRGLGQAKKFFERWGFEEMEGNEGEVLRYEKRLTADESGLDVRIVSWDDEEGVALRDKLIGELLASGVKEDELGPPLTADEMPVFLVVWKEGVPVGCGGLRVIPEDSSAIEIKRMYIVPEARGRQHGVSDRLMRELENEAARRGWKTVRLATGTEMVQARKFYERYVYVAGKVYGEYVETGETVFYEKRVGRDRDGVS